MRRFPLIAVIAAVVLAGCGGSNSSEPQSATIAIDFTPNAVHAPIYAAVREGLDHKHALNLSIRGPGTSPDSLKLLLAGRADVAVLDIHDLGLARERGADVVGIGALVNRPLAAIITSPAIKRPRELEGKRVGVSGLPSDPAVLRPVIQYDGGDFSKLHLTTIGFNAVPNLITKKVAGVPAFWNVEGVVLRQKGFNPHVFKLDDFGAPHYPEVVLVTKRKTLEQRPAMIRAVLASIADGTRSVIKDPQPAVRDVANAAEADPKLIAAELAAVRPVLNPTLAFDRKVLEQWAVFDARFGILKRKPSVDQTFALKAGS
jgi:NitT/TauT family transport system substrate-binding protein/putative hydroxymethylpyrimidine transport system substrate-binding protein